MKQRSFLDEQNHTKQMAELIANSVINNITFNVKISHDFLRPLIKGYLRKMENFDFKVYQDLKIPESKLGKFAEIKRGVNNFKAKFHFFLKRAYFDSKPLYIIDRMDVQIYQWANKSHCRYTVKNGALIQKIIRLMSLKSKEAAEWELYLLVFLPFSGYKPLTLERPHAHRELSLISNIYFDELLLCTIVEGQLSLSLHRFKVDPELYRVYPGTVAGLAKPPTLTIDYTKPNHFDLTTIPQERLKYQLMSGGQEPGSDLRRYHNIRKITYELRRDILGIGTCDVRFEVYVADAPLFKQKSMADDMDINASNSDLFFAAIANRILNTLVHEISKPEYRNKEVDLKMKQSYNPFNRPLHQDMKKPVRTDFTPMHNYFKPNVEVSIERAINEYRPSDKFSKVSMKELLPGKKIHTAKQLMDTVVDKMQFVNKLLRMKEGLNRDKPKSTILSAGMIRRRGEKSPKIFKENEVVMFKITIYPIKSRSSVHKLILSSADIMRLFNVSDFLIEGLGLTVLNWKTVAWIASMDSKTIFNYFCSFLCSRIIMKRWIIYKRPFFIYSKDISRHLYLHQNNFMPEEQKSTQKLLPFLSVQSMDFEFVYNKIIKHKRSFVIITVIKKPKDRMYNLKAFVQNTCRTFSTSFSSEDLTEPVQDFICSLAYMILGTHLPELPTSLEGLLRKIKRDLPRKTTIENSGFSQEGEPLDFKLVELFKARQEVNSESQSSSLTSKSSESKEGVAKQTTYQAHVIKLASSRLIRK